MIEQTERKSRELYVFEAALEYLISILVTGSFLATITKELCISDSLTGILSSVISLGCLFQLLSLFIRKTKVKRFVVYFSLCNQFLFMLLYIIPLTGMAKQLKIVSFIVLICAAYLMFNLAAPKKTSWLMSLVADKERGIFTAKKEMVSLVLGMLFSYGMGAVMDRFVDSNRLRTAFLLAAAVIFILMILHTITMIFTMEKEREYKENGSIAFQVKELLKSKKLIAVTGVFVLYYISNYVSTPFYGTYQINELGFPLKTVSLLVIVGNTARLLVTKSLGKYADRTSFAKMMERCLLFLGAAQLCAFLAVPSNGKMMFTLYYLLHGIALGGINSSLTNLVFDYADPDKRSDTLAITQALAGCIGFLTTVIISRLVTYIQAKGNLFLGISVYAQQLCSLISLLFTIFTIIYIRNVVCKIGRSTENLY